MIRRLVTGMLASLALSCAVTSPGSGSETLFVEADSYAKPDSTRIEVRVLEDDQPVRGANVVVRDLDSDVLYTLEAQGSGSTHRYETLVDGYARALELAVTSGDDELEAALEGPAPHVITRPPDNAIVRRGDFVNLTVEWEADGPSDGVLIAPENAPAIELDGSPTSADVPLSGLADGDQRIRVERWTQVDLRGGLEGSRFKARYKVDNRFTLE